MHRLARQRDRAGKDVQHVRVIKDANGNILTDEARVLNRWKEYFKDLMNVENEREERWEVAARVNGEVQRITEDEVRTAMKKMKNGKAVGPDDIPVEAWRNLGDIAVRLLTRLFNRILKGERMPEE